MPWHVVSNHNECPSSKPYAVVKDSDGSVEGCHATRSDADKQVAALYANEPDAGSSNAQGASLHNNNLAPGIEEAEPSPTSEGVMTVPVHAHEHLGSTDSSVTDAPWNGAASRFTDDQFKISAAACDENHGNTPKAQCFLPHHEPGGATNRNGVHAAAGRVGALQGYSAAAVGRAKSHLRGHYNQLDEDPPDSIAAALELTDDERTALADELDVVLEPYGGEPSPGTPADNRLKRNKRKKSSTPSSSGDTEDLADDEPAPVMSESPNWRGTLVVEGSPTGDGREFAGEALTWGDPPLPLRWQKEDSHGGMPTNVTVRVGSITKVWRDGSLIKGEGVVDLSGPDDDDAHKAYRTMQQNGGMGVSIDADDITDADIEYVFPDADEEDEDGDLFRLLFAAPEKVIFHSARIRAATLCDIPAFIEATISAIPADEQALTAAATVTEPRALPVHHTPVTDEPWDGGELEQALGELHVPTAQMVYGWVDAASANGDARKVSRFLHHDAKGQANLTACAAQVAALGTSELPASERRAVYEHLAVHLRDGELEPPPLVLPDADALVAHAWHDEYRPPRDWFDDPQLGQVTPILVSDSGRVYGHAAQWGACHLGFMNECVMPPHEDYHDHYLTGEVICADGSRVAVGQVTAGLTHADLALNANRAREHYENTDAVVADVRTGNDKHGIWVAGSVRPSAQAARVSALRGSGQVSPDWRWIGGGLRLIALLTVNTSGYTVPRARSFVASGQIRSLVSSGMVTVRPATVTQPTEEELDLRALKLLSDRAAARVHG